MRSRVIPILTAVIVFSAFVIGCQSRPEVTDTRAIEEAAIRAAGEAWMKAMSEKDVDKIMSFFAPDARSWWSGAVEVDTETIRKDVTAAFADSLYALTWSINLVKVARSGDLAYELGTYQETSSDTHREPRTRGGDYLTIWEKQADGSWKASVDIGVLTQ